MLKKFLLIPIFAMMCGFAQIDSFYAGTCGINNLDTSIGGTAYGYTCLNGNAGSREANYGLTTGSGEWAVEYSYGTVWGMSKCSETAGNNSYYTWPESSKSDWLKTPSDTNGQYCWCQATGFTATASSYTSGPQCTTTASSLWVFTYGFGSYDYCADSCAYYCAARLQGTTTFRVALFGAVPQDIVNLNWYDGNSTITGPSSCTVGDTFLPPTPAARVGYIFKGWKVKDPTCGINQLDTSIDPMVNASYGYTRLNGNAGSREANYGLTVGSGQWAVQFSYGTVWGMAKCSETAGNNSSATWPESSKSDWLKTPSDTTGVNCWCQATGFTATASSYTSGPQCTTTASSLWVFRYDLGSSDNCAYRCAASCAGNVQDRAAFRVALFGAAGQ